METAFKDREDTLLSLTFMDKPLLKVRRGSPSAVRLCRRCMGGKAAGTHTLIWSRYRLGMNEAEVEGYLKVPHVM